MYRDDLEAAHARARALEEEVERLKREHAEKEQARAPGLALRSPGYPAVVTSHATNILMLALVSFAVPLLGIVAVLWANHETQRMGASPDGLRAAAQPIDHQIVGEDSRRRVKLARILGAGSVVLWLILGLARILAGL